MTMVLSGMSNLTQMQENIETFREEKPLSRGEREVLLDLAEGMKDSLPCTVCRYCCGGCPMGLDIPKLIRVYNELRFDAQLNAVMQVEFLPPEKKPSVCVACGACAQVCPQNIDIPGALQDLSQRIASLPSWAEICRQREEAAKKA